LPQPYGTDADEGNVRDHVPEIGYAEERALIGEIVITLILNNRRQQKQSKERRKHKNEKTKYAATHLGRIAQAADQVRKHAPQAFSAHSTSNRWQ
jgi:hypothetical protein